MIPLELRDHFQCLYPMTDHLLEAMLNRMDPTSLLMHTKESCGVALIFVNPNNNHWRLIVVDGMQKQVTLFDPLGVPLPSTLNIAIRAFVGSEYVVTDMQSCLQAEGWNCGIWSVCLWPPGTSLQLWTISGMATLRPPLSSFNLVMSRMGTQCWTSTARVHSDSQNRLFAGELRKQYSALLVDARASGRLL